ncbi:hypothetical protein DVH24_021052 [Malus domestica]|uniref:Uncharacterized protein n=1 Tax=Malus domestica TaxID=3750 RepID=A0A498J8B7_MALDO|nr:hypothetical protein DVH24_021052 [Malus domestica]
MKTNNGMSFCSSLSSPHSLFLLSKTKSPSSRFRACAADVPDFLSADWLESRKKRPFGPRLNFSAEEAVQHQLDALKYNDQPRPDYGIEVMYRFAGFDPFERSTYFGPFFDLGQFERFRRIFHHSTYRVLLGHKERKMLSSLYVEENLFKQRVWIRGCRPEEEEIFQFTMVQATKHAYKLCCKTYGHILNTGFHTPPKRKKYRNPLVAVSNRKIMSAVCSASRQARSRVGGSWDGYWLTESVLHDGDAFAGGLAY